MPNHNKVENRSTVPCHPMKKRTAHSLKLKRRMKRTLCFTTQTCTSQTLSHQHPSGFTPNDITSNSFNTPPKHIAPPPNHATFRPIQSLTNPSLLSTIATTDGLPRPITMAAKMYKLQKHLFTTRYDSHCPTHSKNIQNNDISLGEHDPPPPTETMSFDMYRQLAQNNSNTTSYDPHNARYNTLDDNNNHNFELLSFIGDDNNNNCHYYSQHYALAESSIDRISTMHYGIPSLDEVIYQHKLPVTVDLTFHPLENDLIDHLFEIFSAPNTQNESDNGTDSGNDNNSQADDLINTYQRRILYQINHPNTPQEQKFYYYNYFSFENDATNRRYSYPIQVKEYVKALVSQQHQNNAHNSSEYHNNNRLDRSIRTYFASLSETRTDTVFCPLQHPALVQFLRHHLAPQNIPLNAQYSAVLNNVLNKRFDIDHPFLFGDESVHLKTSKNATLFHNYSYDDEDDDWSDYGSNNRLDMLFDNDYILFTPDSHKNGSQHVQKAQEVVKNTDKHIKIRSFQQFTNQLCQKTALHFKIYPQTSLSLQLPLPGSIIPSTPLNTSDSSSLHNNFDEIETDTATITNTNDLFSIIMQYIKRNETTNLLITLHHIAASGLTSFPNLAAVAYNHFVLRNYITGMNQIWDLFKSYNFLPTTDILNSTLFHAISLEKEASKHQTPLISSKDSVANVHRLDTVSNVIKLFLHYSLPYDSDTLSVLSKYHRIKRQPAAVIALAANNKYIGWRGDFFTNLIWANLSTKKHESAMRLLFFMYREHERRVNLLIEEISCHDGSRELVKNGNAEKIHDIDSLSPQIDDSFVNFIKMIATQQCLTNARCNITESYHSQQDRMIIDGAKIDNINQRYNITTNNADISHVFHPPDSQPPPLDYSNYISLVSQIYTFLPTTSTINTTSTVSPTIDTLTPIDANIISWFSSTLPQKDTILLFFDSIRSRLTHISSDIHRTEIHLSFYHAALVSGNVRTDFIPTLHHWHKLNHKSYSHLITEMVTLIQLIDFFVAELPKLDIDIMKYNSMHIAGSTDIDSPEKKERFEKMLSFLGNDDNHDLLLLIMQCLSLCKSYVDITPYVFSIQNIIMGQYVKSKSIYDIHMDTPKGDENTKKNGKGSNLTTKSLDLSKFLDENEVDDVSSVKDGYMYSQLLAELFQNRHDLELETISSEKHISKQGQIDEISSRITALLDIVAHQHGIPSDIGITPYINLSNHSVKAHFTSFIEYSQHPQSSETTKDCYELLKNNKFYRQFTSLFPHSTAQNNSKEYNKNPNSPHQYFPSVAELHASHGDLVNGNLNGTWGVRKSSNSQKLVQFELFDLVTNSTINLDESSLFPKYPHHMNEHDADSDEELADLLDDGDKFWRNGEKIDKNIKKHLKEQNFTCTVGLTNIIVATGTKLVPPHALSLSSDNSVSITPTLVHHASEKLTPRGLLRLATLQRLPEDASKLSPAAQQVMLMNNSQDIYPNPSILPPHYPSRLTDALKYASLYKNNRFYGIVHENYLSLFPPAYQRQHFIAKQEKLRDDTFAYLSVQKDGENDNPQGEGEDTVINTQLLSHIWSIFNNVDFSTPFFHHEIFQQTISASLDRTKSNGAMNYEKLGNTPYQQHDGAQIVQKHATAISLENTLLPLTVTDNKHGIIQFSVPANETSALYHIRAIFMEFRKNLKHHATLSNPDLPLGRCAHDIESVRVYTKFASKHQQLNKNMEMYDGTDDDNIPSDPLSKPLTMRKYLMNGIGFDPATIQYGVFDAYANLLSSLALLTGGLIIPASDVITIVKDEPDEKNMNNHNDNMSTKKNKKISLDVQFELNIRLGGQYYSLAGSDANFLKQQLFVVYESLVPETFAMKSEKRDNLAFFYKKLGISPRIVSTLVSSINATQQATAKTTAIIATHTQHTKVITPLMRRKLQDNIKINVIRQKLKQANDFFNQEGTIEPKNHHEALLLQLTVLTNERHVSRSQNTPVHETLLRRITDQHKLIDLYHQEMIAKEDAKGDKNKKIGESSTNVAELLHKGPSFVNSSVLKALAKLHSILIDFEDDLLSAHPLKSNKTRAKFDYSLGFSTFEEQQQIALSPYQLVVHRLQQHTNLVNLIKQAQHLEQSLENSINCGKYQKLRSYMSTVLDTYYHTSLDHHSMGIGENDHVDLQTYPSNRRSVRSQQFLSLYLSSLMGADRLDECCKIVGASFTSLHARDKTYSSNMLSFSDYDHSSASIEPKPFYSSVTHALQKRLLGKHERIKAIASSQAVFDGVLSKLLSTPVDTTEPSSLPSYLGGNKPTNSHSHVKITIFTPKSIAPYLLYQSNTPHRFSGINDSLDYPSLDLLGSLFAGLLTTSPSVLYSHQFNQNAMENHRKAHSIMDFIVANVNAMVIRAKISQKNSNIDGDTIITDPSGPLAHVVQQLFNNPESIVHKILGAYNHNGYYATTIAIYTYLYAQHGDVVLTNSLLSLYADAVFKESLQSVTLTKTALMSLGVPLSEQINKYSRSSLAPALGKEFFDDSTFLTYHHIHKKYSPKSKRSPSAEFSESGDICSLTHIDNNNKEIFLQQQRSKDLLSFFDTDETPLPQVVREDTGNIPPLSSPICSPLNMENELDAAFSRFHTKMQPQQLNPHDLIFPALSLLFSFILKCERQSPKKLLIASFPEGITSYNTTTTNDKINNATMPTPPISIEVPDDAVVAKLISVAVRFQLDEFAMVLLQRLSPAIIPPDRSLLLATQGGGMTIAGYSYSTLRNMNSLTPTIVSIDESVPPHNYFTYSKSWGELFHHGLLAIGEGTITTLWAHRNNNKFNAQLSLILQRQVGLVSTQNTMLYHFYTIREQMLLTSMYSSSTRNDNQVASYNENSTSSPHILSIKPLTILSKAMQYQMWVWRNVLFKQHGISPSVASMEEKFWFGALSSAFPHNYVKHYFSNLNTNRAKFLQLNQSQQLIDICNEIGALPHITDSNNNSDTLTTTPIAFTLPMNSLIRLPYIYFNQSDQDSGGAQLSVQHTHNNMCQLQKHRMPSDASIDELLANLPELSPEEKSFEQLELDSILDITSIKKSPTSSEFSEYDAFSRTFSASMREGSIQPPFSPAQYHHIDASDNSHQTQLAQHKSFVYLKRLLDSLSAVPALAPDLSTVLQSKKTLDSWAESEIQLYSDLAHQLIAIEQESLSQQSCNKVSAVNISHNPAFNKNNNDKPIKTSIPHLKKPEQQSQDTLQANKEDRFKPSVALVMDLFNGKSTTSPQRQSIISQFLSHNINPIGPLMLTPVVPNPTQYNNPTPPSPDSNTSKHKKNKKPNKDDIITQLLPPLTALPVMQDKLMLYKLDIAIRVISAIDMTKNKNTLHQYSVVRRLLHIATSSIHELNSAFQNTGFYDFDPHHSLPFFAPRNVVTAYFSFFNAMAEKGEKLVPKISFYNNIIQSVLVNGGYLPQHIGADGIIDLEEFRAIRQEQYATKQQEKDSYTNEKLGSSKTGCFSDNSIEKHAFVDKTTINHTNKNESHQKRSNPHNNTKMRKYSSDEHPKSHLSKEERIAQEHEQDQLVIDELLGCTASDDSYDMIPATSATSTKRFSSKQWLKKEYGEHKNKQYGGAQPVLSKTQEKRQRYKERYHLKPLFSDKDMMESPLMRLDKQISFASLTDLSLSDLSLLYSMLLNKRRMYDASPELGETLVINYNSSINNDLNSQIDSSYTVLTKLQATHIQEQYVKQVLLSRSFQSKLRVRSQPIKIPQLYDFDGIDSHKTLTKTQLNNKQFMEKQRELTPLSTNFYYKKFANVVQNGIFTKYMTFPLPPSQRKALEQQQRRTRYLTDNEGISIQ